MSIYGETVKAPFIKVVAFAANVDQDQSTQNVQPDLRYILSAVLDFWKQKIFRNVPPALSFCRIKMSIEFIPCFKRYGSKV